MRAWLLLPASLLLAATYAAPARAQIAERVIKVRELTRRVGSDRVVADTMGTPFDVPYAAARVFTTLGGVYAELKIPTEVHDSAALELGTDGFSRRGDLGGRSLSIFFDCGQGVTGPFADFNQIDLSVVSFVTPTGPASATVRTVVLGTAVKLTEGGSPSRICSSTGELERRIHRLLMRKLPH
jgi:hypothetical protein